MPESWPSPCVETSLVSCSHEPGYGPIIVGSEIKGFVKLAGARQFRVARAQARIFGNFTKVHMMEAGHPNSGFLRNFIECLADFCVGASQGDAEITRRAYCAGNFQTEVPVREEDSPAIFRNEGVIVPQLSADRFNLLACSRGEQNERYFPPFEFRQGLFRACKGICVRIYQGAVER